MYYESQALKEIPGIISPQDRERLMYAETLESQSRILLYEEMMERYTDSHPFLLVRLAELFVLLGAGSLAVNLFRKARDILSRMRVVDQVFYDFVDKDARQIEEQVNRALATSRADSYQQKWNPTKQHLFPTSLPHLPLGAQEIKDKWQALTPSGSTFFAAYLKSLAIETNHVEGTFLLTAESSQDLVRRGLSEGVVNYLPESHIQDTAIIKSILNDTLSAYNFLGTLATDPKPLNKDVICSIHACLMNTCRFSDGRHYIAAGKTRTETRKTVIIGGSAKIECCPFPDVDMEVEYICKMAKVVFVLYPCIHPRSFISCFRILVAMDHIVAEPFRSSKLVSPGLSLLPSV